MAHQTSGNMKIDIYGIISKLFDKVNRKIKRRIEKKNKAEDKIYWEQLELFPERFDNNF